MVTKPSQKMDSITMIACITRILICFKLKTPKKKKKKERENHYLSLERDIERDHLKSSKRHRSVRS
jgi:hypothetical protein